ncbi:Lrp/AsnC family transcriptional regulator [Streptomyces werraensis]|uniref:Lrp/AsnC family transcriptional regulator n=1 Tax=Streptomyces werraensis TaxID=68284 RepID=UPI003807514A
MSGESTATLDALDWAILEELQRDARSSYAELARRVALSPSAVTDRVRRLEALGVITGYHAAINPVRVGLTIQAIVRLKYPGTAHQPLHQLIAQRPEILQCHRVTGDECYVIRIATRDVAHLEQVVDELARLGSLTTNVVYSTLLPRRAVTRTSAGG